MKQNRADMKDRMIKGNPGQPHPKHTEVAKCLGQLWQELKKASE